MSVSFKRSVGYDSNQLCPICYDPFGRSAVDHDGMHHMHEACAKSWFARHLVCPICQKRADISSLMSRTEKISHVINHVFAAVCYSITVGATTGLQCSNLRLMVLGSLLGHLFFLNSLKISLIEAGSTLFSTGTGIDKKTSATALAILASCTAVKTVEWMRSMTKEDIVAALTLQSWSTVFAGARSAMHLGAAVSLIFGYASIAITRITAQAARAGENRRVE